MAPHSLPSGFARLALVLLAGLAAACGDDGPPRGLILITIDTYRGDHFLAEHAGEPFTPRLAQLAGRAERFSNAHSVSNCTTPGMAGILTGYLPRRSGVVTNFHLLPAHLGLANRLRAAGFRTGAVVSNPVLRPGMGFDGGFDVYTLLRHEGDERKGKPRAARVNAAALEWLDGLARDERFFLWAHYMEPHGPYDPAPEFQALFPRESFAAPQDVPLLDEESGRGGIPRYQQQGVAPAFVRDARDYLARYAGEVRAMDRELGALFDELERRGLLDACVLVLTSDHGEALAGDAGHFFSHDNGVTQDQVHVPLLLAYPGCERGAVREQPVSTTDIVPTVLALLGLAAHAELDGVPLFPLAAPGGRPGVVSQIEEGTAVRSGPWKLVRKANGARELLDLSRGGLGELVEGGAPPEILRALEARLEAVDALVPLAPSVDRRERPGAGD